MKRRLRAALVIARRQAFETLLSPGLYVTLALGLLLGFFLVSGFAASIDSAGFNPTLNPVYDMLGRSLAGAFGSAFVEKLFAEGPFLFALLVSFFPVFLFLSISSVFRFGQEKNAGALELLAYGPADGTSYIVASFLKDIAFTAASLALIVAFLGMAAMGDYLWAHLNLKSPAQKTYLVGLMQSTLEVYAIKNIGYNLAVGVMLFIPYLIVFSLSSKYFIAGLTTGGIKG